MRFSLLFLLCVVFQLAKATTESTYLPFEDYDNYLYRDDTTSVQLLFTSPKAQSSIKPRFLAAFPAGDSGLLLFLKPVTASNDRLNIQLVSGSLSSVTQNNNRVGISGQWTLSQDAQVEKIVMGSVRSVRDYIAQGTVDIDSPKFSPKTKTSVTYYYNFIKSTTSMQFVLSTTNEIKVSGNQPTFPAGTYNFTLTLNLPSLTPLYAADILRSEAKSLATDDKTKNAIQSLAFLAYKEKFIAGGWEYLTYFGRDSLISLRLLMSILSNDAIEAGLTAVFDRINANGSVCHEETIGDYAAYLHRKHGDSNTDPICSYVMVDQNYELLPFFSDYYLYDPLGKGKGSTFLNKVNKKGVRYGTLLEQNVRLVLSQAKKFYDQPNWNNLVQFSPGSNVGNWRDSEGGNGKGRIPYDVNVALMPSSLRSIELLADAKLIPVTYKNTASTYRKTWEDKAAGFFKVKLDATASQQSIKNYWTTFLSLPESLLSSNSHVPENLHALSLKYDGTSVNVMNSDFSFNLLYHDDLDADFLHYVIDALQPFPQGLLLDGVGLLVANPAYDKNNYKSFTTTDYHGTTVWSFQQTMVVVGLDHQLKLCDLPDKRNWCNDANLVKSLKDANCRVWSVIEANPNADYAETWSWKYDQSNKKFVPLSPADLNPQADEPDAVQLWSFSLLAATKPDYCKNGPPSKSSTEKPKGSAASDHANLLSLFSLAFMLLFSKLF